MRLAPELTTRATSSLTPPKSPFALSVKARDGEQIDPEKRHYKLTPAARQQLAL